MQTYSESTKREWNLQTHGSNDESSNHRKYVRTQTSSNNRIVPSSSSSQQQRQNGDKDKKTVKDSKKPLRVSGDWSEFKSSTGKTYFYNSKTEISQWEKPKGWSTDETSSSSTRSSSTSTSNDRTKKESTNSSISPTIRSRHKVEESSQNSRSNIKYHQNGDIHSQTINNPNHESNETLNKTSNVRLPSPSDDNSQMSFSSTNSKESSSVTISDRNGSILHSSLSESTISVSTPVSDIPTRQFEKDSTSSNETDMKNSTTRSISRTILKTDQTSVTESSIHTVSKAERDQEIQKYYRSDLIKHLTDWPSSQLEKQCLKLFDDYYRYSAKMSTAFIELKALKSNFRILEIKRSISTQRLLRCQQHIKKREDDKLL
ncbi:unnamed protein product [Adineta steineri]|uniref:WW domain-containing protein n=1 Tax=Adineta steineri TaxID=433720 RepID=A0A815MW91_9BILA|nr:unnamed protein product [Adineta steineri]CAF1621846.1 unnamed protein product [Adineta steineri]